MTLPIRIAKIVTPTEAEGPGARFALWLQGCPLRCRGCCNPEMLSQRGGSLTTVAETVARIEAAAASIEGVTFLGGEPFAQAEALAPIAEAAQALGLSVMIFSGHTAAELRDRQDAETKRLLAATDLLVDGPYQRELPDTVRRWIGSRNQVMHFLSDRYSPGDPRFAGAETVEIRYAGGELTVNGWPASADGVTALLTERLKRRRA